MEGVDDDRWTQVFTTKRGRPVRADFHLTLSEPLRRRVWEQEVIGTPFERVLDEAITEVVLEPADGGTQVTIALRQKLRGYSRTGGFMLRRAASSSWPGSRWTYCASVKDALLCPSRAETSFRSTPFRSIC